MKKSPNNSEIISALILIILGGFVISLIPIGPNYSPECTSQWTGVPSCSEDNRQVMQNYQSSNCVESFRTKFICGLDETCFNGICR